MGARKVVLIVDDSEDLADACEFVLRRAGFEVAVAMDGEQGLERAASLAPQLIVLDMMMPNVDGLQFLERLPRYCSPSPPVIAYSGFHQLEQLALARGAAAFLPKPFELGTLGELAQAVVASAPTEETVRESAAFSEECRASADKDREQFWREVTVDERLRADLRHVTAWASGYFGAERAFVTALHSQRLHVLAEHGADDAFPEGCAMDPQLNFCPDVIRAATPLVLNDTQGPPFAGHAAAEMVRFYAGAPLLVGPLAVGTLCLEHSRPARFDAEDMGLVGYLARQIGDQLAALRTHRTHAPLFFGDRLLSGAHITVLVAAELRRAERDGAAVELAIAGRLPDESVARAVLGAAGPERMLVAACGETTALLVADHDGRRASLRIDCALERLSRDVPLAGVGVVSYSAMADRILPPEVFLRLAVTARLRAAGGLRRIRA
jgi:DNA-binding response OmpR family regulator